MRLTLFAMISALLLSSCQTSPIASPDMINHDFQTQALTQPYLSRKINRWLNTNQGARLLRELQYAQTKHPTLMQQVISQAANPTTLYNQIRAVSEVSSYSSSNGPFNTFLQSLSPVLDSCKAYYNQGARDSGIYWIDPDGAGSTAALQVYCDQVHDGGGWTMVVAQFESDPVTDWNEGTQSDYNPQLGSSKGFALSSSQIPTHTQTAFGKDKDATFVDYVNFTYTTGNIALTAPLAGGKVSGMSYRIHRSTSNYYDLHDTGESNLSNGANWLNSLAIDGVGDLYFHWAFSPNNVNSIQRGHSMLGHIRTSSENYAWTIWVR